MRAHQISSVLVGGDPAGIVTDGDLAHRVLAEGLGAAAPLAQVVSRPLRTVEAATPLHEAWTRLLELGFHHLPVTRGAEVVGVVTANDLLKASTRGPMALLREVERLASRAELPGYARKIAEMDAALLAGGLDAAAIARLVSRLGEALLGRIFAWAEEELGPAPAPWAWLAFGSEARREQPLLTDQDNALVYADEGADRRDWFQAFAERVNDDLEAAGIAACTFGNMARALNGTLSEWKERFHACVDERRPHPAALWFDHRKLGGALDVGPLAQAQARAARNGSFLRMVARAAIEHEPPSSVRLRLRGEATTVDLKAQGLVPVVFLARCHALEIGAEARGTLERLEAAARSGILSEDRRASVAEAYRFLLGLRLRHELQLVKEGRPPSSLVHLSALSAVERSRLKESFRAIRRWQERAAYHYRTDFF
jgi:CBS domain-containing protein